MIPIVIDLPSSRHIGTYPATVRDRVADISFRLK